MDDAEFKSLTERLQNATPEQKKVFREALSEKASEEAPGTQAVAVPAPAKKRHAELSDRLIAAAELKLDGNDPRQRAGTFLFNPITNQLKRSPTSGGGSASYDLSGNPKETGPGSPDDLRTDRLPRMKEESAEAAAEQAAEQAHRQGIRDSVALVTPFSAYPDGSVRPALEGRDIFRDAQGRIEDPAALRARLVKEGWNLNDATIAAEQRSRDMFDAPNAKNDGQGVSGMQRNAVLSTTRGLRPDGTSPRMDVMQQLKNARKDNLESLTAARLNNPFRKEVGVTTKIETSDGRVLAEREESVGVARGGTGGAVGGSVDKIGPMKLTSDGKRAIANRTSVATTTPEKLGFQSTNPSPQEKKDFENSFKSKNPDSPVPGADRPTNEVQVVTGRFGTAVGGAPSIKDQLVSQGKLPQGFELTPEQRTGQAPLPKEYAAMKQELLTNAANVARNEGTISDPGTRAVMRGVGPQGVAAIDTATAKAVADQKMVQESKASDATLRSIYSPAQMDDLDKTIVKANKTGGVVSPKADGTFGIEKKPDPFFDEVVDQLAKSPQEREALSAAFEKTWKNRQAAKKKG